MHSDIKPLSPEVIAQIGSSVVINSLSDAVLGLLRNSLDSDATRVDVAVDFARGNCSIEDDGVGIPGEEFHKHGNLGQAYCRLSLKSMVASHLLALGTSKTLATNVYGTQAELLTSLASLSLLNITSRHEKSGSENTAFFHYSKRLSNADVAWSSQSLDSSTHGTRVVVRNLFGNMPVRIKQRTLLEDQGGIRREWRSLVLFIANLLISWHRPVSIFVQDELTGQRVAIVDRQARLEDSISSQTAFNVALVLNILTQTSLIDPNSRSSFIPVSGSTSAINIKGVICTEPSPSKEKQFISLGVEPIWRDGQHNELFEIVNRVFATSDFGMIDEGFAPDEAEHVRRSSNHRLKTNKGTGTQLRINKKGVDRWPIFYFRITIENSNSFQIDGRSIGAETQATLRSVGQVLEAISVRWLTKRQFCPQKLRQRPETVQIDARIALQDRHNTGSDAFVSKSEHEHPWSSDKPGTRAIGVERRRAQTWAREPNFDSTRSSMPSRSKSAGDQSINAWSRMKSGALVPCRPVVLRRPEPHVAMWEPRSDFQIKASEGNVADTYRNDNPLADLADETLHWQDTVTKEMFLVNARSGAILPKESVNAVAHSTSRKLCTRLISSTRTGTDSSQYSRSEQPSKWITEILDAWDNPVFRPSEARMDQAHYDLLQGEGALQSQLHDSCMRPKVLKPPDTMDKSTISHGRLTVNGLKNASIISQVDNKFILVRLPGDPAAQQEGRGEGKRSCDMLALIDQHAADERCKVESLFKEISLPSPACTQSTEEQMPGLIGPSLVVLHKPIVFVATIEESVLLHESIPYFARWGISYDISTVRHQANSKVGSKQIKVKALPRGIAERCVAEPHLLIDLIREYIWDKDRKKPRAPSLTCGVPRQDHNWLQEIGACPQGIVDMLKSRACRSAIMFNDRLSKAQCEALVSCLAETAFPFQCAHGRPSMVPLLKIESDEASDGRGLHCVGSDVLLNGHEDGATTSFTEQFKLWRGINRPKESRRDVLTFDRNSRQLGVPFGRLEAP